MRCVLMVAVCISMIGPGAVEAGPVRVATGSRLRPDQINDGYREGLLGLRKAALDQQTLDGGKLNDRHLATFQRQLDTINDRYRRKWRNDNPLSIDSDGHAVPFKAIAGDWTTSRIVTVGSPN